MVGKNKTRIVKAKRGERSEAAAPMGVSYIDLEQIKKRYGGTPLPDEEEEDEYEEYEDCEECEDELFDEETHGHKRRRKVSESERELNVFGEEEYDEEESRRHSVLAIVFFALLFLSALAGLYFLLLIDEIQVTGNQNLERADILTSAGINVGEHLWFADVGGAVKALEDNPAIRSARVKRVYPNKIAITVEERVPVAAIMGTGSVAVTDIDGYVMEIISNKPAELIAIYGLSSLGFKVGQKLGDYSEFDSKTLNEILGTLENQGILDIIESIDMSQPLKIGMTTSYGYDVNIGQPDNITDKLRNLSLVLSKVQALGYTDGTIDVGVLGDPVYSPPETLYTPVPEDTPTPGESAAPNETPAPQSSPSPGSTTTPTQKPAPVAGSGGDSGPFSG